MSRELKRLAHGLSPKVNICPISEWKDKKAKWYSGHLRNNDRQKRLNCKKQVFWWNLKKRKKNGYRQKTSIFIGVLAIKPEEDIFRMYFQIFSFKNRPLRFEWEVSRLFLENFLFRSFFSLAPARGLKSIIWPQNRVFFLWGSITSG